MLSNSQTTPASVGTPIDAKKVLEDELPIACRKRRTASAAI
jgi:hypothetical protein